MDSASGSEGRGASTGSSAGKIIVGYQVCSLILLMETLDPFSSPIKVFLEDNKTNNWRNNLLGMLYYCYLCR